MRFIGDVHGKFKQYESLIKGVNESIQIDKFLATIAEIKQLDNENLEYRTNVFVSDADPEGQRKNRRAITRRTSKIFELLKEWRLEGDVIDNIEAKINQQIEWLGRH